MEQVINGTNRNLPKILFKIRFIAFTVIFLCYTLAARNFNMMVLLDTLVFYGKRNRKQLNMSF